MYKSKLQELCHQRKWALPRYSAIKDGPDHYPRFRSSIHLHGRCFDAPVACGSLKDAQNEAAKLAFLHFSSAPSAGKSSGITESTSPSLLVTEEARKSPPRSDLIPTSKSPQSPYDEHGSVAASSVSYEKPDEKCKGVDDAEDCNKKLYRLTQKSDEMVEEENLSSPPELVPSSRFLLPAAAAAASLTIEHLRPSSTICSTKMKARETPSYLLCNRVRVYTSFPDITFPEGIILVPIA
ncbi:double-stranded RNA-binding protein 1-like [Punica granatum]|uniref:DRBM domain-containing protein n=2 Tax=Punica granatum TaxID=22663 RepID=A0A218WLB9_PUNGR|nr:double-stranded RNA-binding protein 1-like [Punica granatum]OWM73595.1 hypothetical protein CDL15_Pgr026694 [Punica granatum]PKI40305.1 hypothetical protein CRG98_039330 [Punica granatum]